MIKGERNENAARKATEREKSFVDPTPPKGDVYCAYEIVPGEKNRTSRTLSEDLAPSGVAKLFESSALERLAQRSLKELADALARPCRAFCIPRPDPSRHLHAFL
jgi:hypothetical protein